jgi:hypothetical protein
MMTCAGGNTRACSNVLGLVQNQMAGLGADVKALCHSIMNPAGWTPPSDLVDKCTFYLHGNGLAKGVDATVNEHYQLLSELAIYAGWPVPPR